MLPPRYLVGKNGQIIIDILDILFGGGAYTG